MVRLDLGAGIVPSTNIPGMLTETYQIYYVLSPAIVMQFANTQECNTVDGLASPTNIDILDLALTMHGNNVRMNPLNGETNLTLFTKFNPLAPTKFDRFLQ